MHVFITLFSYPPPLFFFKLKTLTFSQFTRLIISTLLTPIPILKNASNKIYSAFNSKPMLTLEYYLSRFTKEPPETHYIVGVQYACVTWKQSIKLNKIIILTPKSVFSKNCLSAYHQQMGSRRYLFLQCKFQRFSKLIFSICITAN